MKRKTAFSALFSIIFIAAAWGQTQADAILGVWESGNGKARIKIDKAGDKYTGRIVWLREPNDEAGKPKVDKNNPEEALRTKPLLGYSMLKGFSYKGEKTWEDGTIYDPESGSTYSCTITMTDDNTLDVRGYIGVSLFGRTDVWKRVVVKKK
ncbi:MAG: DUF2147 domain-containing protein [Cyclobacteriaceae bacterium]|jgi:uncharacterized protein (DUF2147 family)|nr:DUF2147 domain-containing protein [Cyclobacteriaceae bacterium]